MKPAYTPFSPEQKLWIALVVQKATPKEIYDKVFHVDIEKNPELRNRCDCKLTRWRKHPDYQKEWDAAYKTIWGDALLEATQVAIEGLRDKDNPWRRTQHANMVLSYGTRLINGEEQNTVHVQIEGLPDIGSPDDSE